MGFNSGLKGLNSNLEPVLTRYVLLKVLTTGPSSVYVNITIPFNPILVSPACCVVLNFMQL